MTITCISHNVKGFNSPMKRRKAFDMYGKIGAKILLLQETHFAHFSHPKYFHRNYPQSFYTLYSSKSRGAAIFLHASLPIEVTQCFKDRESRFVIIKGLLHNKEITIASVYAPNDAPASFFKIFFDKLTSLNSPHIIIGGDFNLVANPTLDRSASTMISKAFPRSLTQGLLEHQLVDTWRAHNTSHKEFTFYSHPHKSYARLDYIYTTPIILANSNKAMIYPCVWSDHQVTSFTTEFIGLAPTPYIWRLNEALLSDILVESDTAKSIEEYFSLNALPDTPPSILWTAHKAVIRGKLISIASSHNKNHRQRILTLTTELDRIYKDTEKLGLESTRKTIDQKRLDLDSLLSSKIEKELRWSKAKILLHNNTSSTLFARKLNQSTRPTHVYKLSSSTGHPTSHPKEVLRIFEQFYSSLLSPNPNHPSPADDAWFQDLHIPSLSASQVEKLNAPVTTSEVLNVIKSLRSGSAPGPDGFSAIYYKKFAPLLSPSLVQLFNWILQGGDFPEEMLLANMSLIPKPNKNHLLPQNYRPISVMNIDVKIFSRILADRLASIISTLISPFQSGFIPHRFITDNIRLATNIIQDSNLNSRKLFLLGLDIHKAFDSVSWKYLNSLLQRMGFRDEFLQGFSALYANPKTRIKIPGCNSEFFPIGRGTRQGCPLSPLIFALALEPLAIAILNNQNISGYTKGPSSYKFCMYADDVLLFLTNPHISIPNLLQTLSYFAGVSGLRVNVSKSIALPLGFSPTKLQQFKQTFHFVWKESSLSYLGIDLAGDLSKLFDYNYPPMISKLKKTLHSWSQLRISFLGRITALRMVILPRLLYLFRSLPIRVSKSYLHTIQTFMNKFIWQNKAPRFAKEVLYRSSKSGGLGVPRIWHYYIACRLAQQAQWNIRDSKVPWVKFEQDSISPLYLPGLMWSSGPLLTEVSNKNLIVKVSLALWNRYKDKYNLISHPSLGASYIGDPRFPTAFSHPEVFEIWTQHNLITLKDFLINSKFTSFESLKSRHLIPDREFYHFLQIRHFFQKHYPTPPSDHSTLYEDLCHTAPRQKGLISQIHSSLVAVEDSPPLKYRSQWEHDLALDQNTIDWDRGWTNICKSSKSLSIKETAIKLMTRWYYTPTRIQKIYPQSSPQCFRGCTQLGTYLHIFWECEKLQPTWTEVLKLIDRLVGNPINLTFQHCILFQDVPKITKPQLRLVHSICIATLWCIALHWKSPSIPFAQIIARIDSIKETEKIFHTLHDSIPIFDIKWNPWFLFRLND